jgi:cobalt-zinc-cadmium efflux system protein
LTTDPRIEPTHPGHHAGTATRRLAWVLALTLTYMVAEVLGGLLANSLALLADAGHMMTDNLALTLALLAAWFSRRPPDESRTYGYQRLEILAALVNGVALVVVCLFIVWEAWERLLVPREIDFGLMSAVAAGGLVVNLIAARILHGHHHGLNVRAAYLHVLGDLLGSVGALTAAGLIAAFGWTWADPVASLLICVIILISATRLVLRSLHVLMEGVPEHLDTREIHRCLVDTPGVEDVHDLHVWSLAGGAPLLTAHLVVDPSASPAEILRGACRNLRTRFGITHTTIQIDPPDYNVVNGLTSEPAARDRGP